MSGVDRFQNDPILGIVDWSLRGVGQVVFQNKPLSGVTILGALFFNSGNYGATCILGVTAGTLAAVALGADQREPVRVQRRADRDGVGGASFWY